MTKCTDRGLIEMASAMRQAVEKTMRRANALDAEADAILVLVWDMAHSYAAMELMAKDFEERCVVQTQE